MSYENHYIGAEEHVIGDSMTDYHRYLPHNCINFDLLSQSVQDRLNAFYTFCTGFAKPGFLPEAVLKSTCGLWITSDDDTFAEDKAYHLYYAFDYGNISSARLTEFYNALGTVEPEAMKSLRSEKIDFGLEGVSVGADGNVLKYVAVFRPNSDILNHFDFPEIDKIKEFVSLNFEEWQLGQENAKTGMRSPIRIQFDAVDDTVSIELTAPYFMKEFYEQGGSTQKYLDRKNLYFERMLQTELLTSDEVAYCRDNSPSHQQFSIKFKWRDGELVNKKLYTFAVIDFERIQ